MRIKIVRATNGTWIITPMSGQFLGKEVAAVDGITMTGVSFEGDAIYGTAQSVWGLVALDPMMFNDPTTVRGLGIGRSFNMMAPSAIEYRNGAPVLKSTGERITKARALWALNADTHVYGEEIRPNA